MNQLEEIINKDKHLSKLLNEKEITVFSNFSRSMYSPELKEYIQDRYVNVFREIYRKSIAAHDLGIANALVRSTDYLATDEAKRVLVDEFTDSVEATQDHLESLIPSLTDSTLPVQVRSAFGEVIDGLTINILNRFGHLDPIKHFKENILSAAFEICDLTAKSKPKREPFKYALYTHILENLSQIDDLGTYQQQFEQQQRKSEKKEFRLEMKYVIWIFFVIILILVRLLMRLDR